MSEQITKKVEERMQKALQALRNDYNTVRGNRASVAIVDHIKVDYYGTPTALSHVGTVSTPEPRVITITPWDKGIIGEIERAIQKAEIGLTPINDGNVIRLNMPSLTEERRRELVKSVKKMAEECRVGMRNIRRDGNEEVKTALKGKQITEDDEKRLLKKVQDLTDDYIKKVDEVTAAKEKDIMEV